MPGGNSRHTLVMDPYPIYATSGQGCIVTDVEGEERIDFVNNYTSLILGHSHPEVTEAVARVIRKGTAFSLPTETDIRLAELLVDRVPYIDQVRFANSGSEGVLLAIRAVAGYETMRRLTPRVFDEFDRLGDRVRGGLGQLLSRHGIEGVATGRGSLFSVVPADKPPKDFRALFSARSAAPQLQRIALEMLNRGILMGARGLFGALSTPMGDAEIDRFLEAADGAAAHVLAS